MQNLEFLKPFPKFISTIGNLPSSYVASLSYEEQLLWLCDFISEKIIPIVNQNTEITNQIMQLFQKLQEYIEHYFENLDVQEEINNKLDKMAEDGTLDEIINQHIFNNKYDYYKINNTMSNAQIQTILDSPRSKILDFESEDYTFNTEFSINSNTILLLNNAIIHNNTIGLFQNFKTTDEFTEYNGNSNISIIGGTILGGGTNFCHAKNITLKNITYLKCSGNHFIQLAGCQDVTIENCNFDGIPITAPNYSEYINIDPMIYVAFPGFDENNPTYDNTLNKNIVIDNCNFTNNVRNENPNFTFYVAIGGHSGATPEDEHPYFENFIIKNCNFDNALHNSCTFITVNNLQVINNNFNSNITTSIDNHNSHIRGWHRMKNVVIKNNYFNGNIKAIIFDDVFQSNSFMDNIKICNNIFNNYDKSVSNPIIHAYGLTNSHIDNNIFQNCTGSAIYIQDTKTKIVTITNNIYNSSLQTNDIIRIYNGTPIIKNNTINIPDNSCPLAFQSATAVVDPVLQNNILNYDKIYWTKGMSCKNIYNIPVKLKIGENYTANNILLDYNIFDFNTLRFTMGWSSQCVNITLKPYFNTTKFQPNTSFWFVTLDNNKGDNYQKPIMGKLSINVDGTINLSDGNGHQPFRNIYGYNE